MLLAFEKFHQGDLFRVQPCQFFGGPMLFLLPQCLEQGTVEIGVENLGVDIALATDGRCVAQILRRLFDRLADILLRLRLCFRLATLFERLDSDNCSPPGTKILCREIFPCDLSQVFIHVGRLNAAHLILLIQIFEQFVAGQVL